MNVTGWGGIALSVAVVLWFRCAIDVREATLTLALAENMVSLMFIMTISESGDE